MAMAQLAQWDVFVSYARKDLDVVIPIEAALQARGVGVWRDEEEIEEFEAITRSVREGVARSRVLLAYYSARYPTRRACQWELTAAFLAAQRLGDPRQRVLVVNPERSGEGAPLVGHIEPVQLRDAVFCAAPALDDPGALVELAESVIRHLGTVEGPLGVSGSLVSRSLGRRPVGSPAFVGRIGELWELHSALTAGEAVQITGAVDGGVTQLSGVGGVGKSLLAEEYALRFSAAYPGGVFWLRASQEQASSTDDGTLEVERDTQLRAIAADLRIVLPKENASPQEIAGRVRAFIERADGRCLWVVDDLPGGLGADRARAWFAPDANATTLLTTRTREYKLLARSVELGGLPAPDGYALLTAQRRPQDAEEEGAARGIVADLAGHPLALTVAGAALQVEAGLRSFADFRAALSQPGEDELELAAQLADALPTGHQPSIAATLLRSIDQLGEEGRDLLRVASMLAADPIPSSLIASTFAHADNLEAAAARRRAVRAIVGVDRLSLADAADAGGATRRVHALVARTMRFYEDNPARADTLQTAVGASLSELLGDFIVLDGRKYDLDYDPMQDIDGVAAYTYGQSLIAHGREFLRRSNSPEAQLGYLLGLLLEEWGDLEAAEAAYRRADEGGIAAGAWNLALLLEERGELRQAEAAYRRADERGSAAGAWNLALLLEERGELRQAEAAYRRADERGSAAGAWNLALLLEERGELRRAEAAYRRADKRDIGPGETNLGGSLEEQGELKNIRKITRATEMAAAKSLSRAEMRMEALRPYAEAMRLMTRQGVQAAVPSLPIAVERDEIKRVGILVVGGDRGLAGAFTANVVRAALAAARELSAEGHEPVLFVSGTRAASSLASRGLEVAYSFIGFTDRPAYADARRIAKSLMAAYVDGEVDRVEVFYNGYISPVNQEIRREVLLPLQQATVFEDEEGDAEAASEDRAQPGAPVEFVPDAEEIFELLVPDYMDISIYRALLESTASEHGARMTAMRNAS